MAIRLIGWRGPSAPSGGASIPPGGAGQVLGYGAGGVPQAVDLPAAPTWSTLADKPTAFPPEAHSHEIAGVNGLQAALNDKAAAAHSHAWADITARPADFPPSAHQHAVGDVGGLQTALDGKATVTQLPAALNAPYIQPARLDQGAANAPLPLGYISQIDVRHFGAVMVGFGETATQAVAIANRTALQAALDWSSASGGVVYVPGGRLDIYGSLVLPLAAAVRGMSQFGSQIRQRQVPTSLAEPFTSIFTAPAVTGSTGGNGLNIVTDLTIDGGWNMRNYEGATHPNWAHDPTRMTQFAIQTNTPTAGPPISVFRPAWSDAQSRFVNLTIQHVAGLGLDLKGRGGIMITNVEVTKIAKHCMDLSAPDCHIKTMDCSISGDSSAVIRAGAGNLRLSNSKFWYAGLQSAAEGIGAGIHQPDQGTTAIEMHGVSTQDTWGPGLDLAGDTGVYFSGDIDEAGGGRVTQQGFGYTGTRTLPRSCIRLTGTLRRAEINARIRGGGRNGAGTQPALVDFRGSSITGCKIQLNGDLTNISATPIVATSGYTNAKRFNEVFFAKKQLHGTVTKAQLDDPTHGVNDATYGPTSVTMTTGRVATRDSGGAWVVPRLTLTITQAAYDALGTPDPDTDYYIVG